MRERELRSDPLQTQFGEVLLEGDQESVGHESDDRKRDRSLLLGEEQRVEDDEDPNHYHRDPQANPAATHLPAPSAGGNASPRA
jgi:hypothetical protein